MVELLITILIVSLLAAMVLVAFGRAQETARAQKTRALVTKLDAIIKGKWEAYKTRRAPVKIPPGTPPREAARIRLDALHDLMRMELPERYTDIVKVSNTKVVSDVPSGSYTGIAEPAVYHAYYRRIMAAKNAAAAAGKSPDDVPTVQHQGAELLYQIVTASVADDADERDLLIAQNIGDTDNDGMPEIVDGWGRPIKFLRWAPGFVSDLNMVSYGTVVAADGVGTFTVTLQVIAPDLSTKTGTYVGGTLARLNWNRRDRFTGDASSVARITEYSHNGTHAFLTCSTPQSITARKPFNGGGPAINDTLAVFAPYGFDPMGVYPVYPTGVGFPPGVPDTSVPSFAIHPLIYSAGQDGLYGVVEDSRIGFPPLDYTDEGMYPFYRATSMIGTKEQLLLHPEFPNEPHNYGWTDNIHNHQLTAN